MCAMLIVLGYFWATNEEWKFGDFGLLSRVVDGIKKCLATLLRILSHDFRSELSVTGKAQLTSRFLLITVTVSAT